MRTIFLIVWWLQSTFPVIDEAYPPVISKMTSWPKQRYMKSSDHASSFPSSKRNMELLYPW